MFLFHHNQPLLSYINKRAKPDYKIWMPNFYSTIKWLNAAKTIAA